MARFPENKEVSKYRGNIRDTLLAEILDGNNVDDAAKLPGMPTAKQLKLWLAQDEELRQDFIEAQKISLLEQMSRVVDIADGVDGYETARDRLRVNTRIKVAEKLLPEIYGKTIKHEHSAGESVIDLIQTNKDDALSLPTFREDI